MSNLWNRATNLVGMGPSRTKPKKIVPPAMPDSEELRRVARKKQAMKAQAGGRASTILDEDTLG